MSDVQVETPAGQTVSASTTTPVTGNSKKRNTKSVKKAEKPVAKVRAKYDCTNEQIAMVYQTANSAKEAAEKLGMPVNALNSRLAYMRHKQGLTNLRRFRRGPSKPDMTLLNERLKQMIEEKVNQ